MPADSDVRAQAQANVNAKIAAAKAKVAAERGGVSEGAPWPFSGIR